MPSICVRDSAASLPRQHHLQSLYAEILCWAHAFVAVPQEVQQKVHVFRPDHQSDLLLGLEGGRETDAEVGGVSYPYVRVFEGVCLSRLPPRLKLT
jgi:hypothetical protein